MSKASTPGSVGAVLAMVMSGLVGAVIAKAIDNPVMLPAVGAGVVLSVIALGLVPKSGLLRRYHLGRERWVKVVALILICSYPLVLFLSVKEGGELYLSLAPSLSIFAAASLLAWSSFRQKLELTHVMVGVAEIGIGVSMLTIVMSFALTDPLILVFGVGLAAITTAHGATTLRVDDIDADHPLHPYLYAATGICGCVGGLLAFSAGETLGIPMMVFGICFLGMAVGAWAKSEKSNAVAILIGSIGLALVAIQLFTGDRTRLGFYPSAEAFTTAASVSALCGGAHSIARLTGRNIERLAVAGLGAALMILAFPLFNTKFQMAGTGIFAFGLVAIIWGLGTTLNPGRVRTATKWLRSTEAKKSPRDNP